MDSRYDPEALRLARQAAAAGERVLWAGRPGPGRAPDGEVLRPAVLLAVTALTLLGMPDRWDTMVERPWLPAIWVVPLALWLGVAVWLWLRQGQVVYAATDRRVLILEADGRVRHAVGLARADAFRVMGRTLSLGGEEEAYRQGKTDLDGGLRRFEALPRLERLAEPERVLALIRAAVAAQG